MIVHEFRLDMVPNKSREEVWLNQYDDDFLLRIHLYASQGTFEVEAGTTAELRGTKADGRGYSAAVPLTQEADESWMVEVPGDQNMTDCSGKAIFEITLTSDSKLLSTANFLVNIEKAALDRPSEGT